MIRGITAILGAAGLVAVAGGAPVQAQVTQIRGVNTPLAGLVVATTGPADEHKVTAACSYTGQVVAPNTLMVEFTAEAIANGHTLAVSTGVWCEVFNSGGSGSAANAFPGGYAAAAGTVYLPLAPITVCVAGTAHFADTHTAATGPECR